MQRTTWEFVNLKKSAWVVLVVAALFTSAIEESSADIIYYCDVHGTNASFLDIMEVSGSEQEMFGQPEAFSNSISMPAFGFNASASGGIDFRQGLLELTIQSDSGQLIDSVVLNEFGSFFQFGSETDVVVHTSAFVEIDGEFFDADTTFAQNGTGAGNWDQSFTLSFPATDELRLVIDTQVFASAADGEVAFVDKIGMNVSLGSFSAVPEPDVIFALISTAGIGFVFARRRKSAGVEAGI